MANVIEAAFTFFIVIVGGYLALTTLANTNSLSIGNCAYNSTGSLVNCSLSNTEFSLVNATGTQYSTIFVSFSPLIWVLAIAVIIAVFLQIAGWVR